MKIESIIRREGGSKVTLDGVTYLFKPDESGRHVANIENIEHLGVLLEIREGYRVVEDDQADNVPDLSKASEPLSQSATLAPVDNPPADVEGDALEQSEGSGSDATDEDADTQDDEQSEGEQSEGEQSDSEQADEEGKTDNQELDREALAVEFNEKFGRRPHNRWSAERIQQELQGE